MPETLAQASEHRVVRIPVDSVHLDGNLSIPKQPFGVVLFAHGTGSGRFSPRNQYVARRLHQLGLATLLIDLFTPEEEALDLQTLHLRFDIALLSERLIDASRWLADNPETRTLPIGYFGASTGAGAALSAAAEHPQRIGAVVSRGGRPDLAGSALARVKAPTLLIVGGNDYPVVEMNRIALRKLNVEKKLQIVHGASHLFEEPGALEEVSRLAGQWFEHYLEVPVERRST